MVINRFVNHKHMCWVFVFLIALLKNISAQNSGQFVEASQALQIPFTVTQYSTKQGLPQSQVTDIIRKKNGCLIISTANGIVEYNGQEFKSFINDPAYKANIYLRIFWHEKTQQLFGREVDGTTHLIFPQVKELDYGKYGFMVNDSIYTIDANGTIYGADVTNLHFKKLFSTGINKPINLFLSGSAFYISAAQKLYKADYTDKTVKEILNGDYFSYVKQNNYNNSIYALGTKKIYRIDKSGITCVMNLTNYPGVSSNNIDFIDDKETLLATSGGLFHITQEYTDLYDKTSALPSQQIHGVYYNKDENCVFLGTGEKGLLKLQLKNCYSLSVKQGFGANSSLSSIIRTGNGDVLVGETLGNLFKVSVDTVFPYISFKAPYSSLAEINDTIYAGTWGYGLYLIKNKTVVDSIVDRTHLPNVNIHGTYKDKQGNLWVGTSNGVAKGRHYKDLKPYLTGKIKKVIIAFYELKNGSLCIGGSEGVYILNKSGQLIRHLSKSDGIEGKEVRSFYEDTEGKLWIGTYDGGLYCYYKNSLTNINTMKNCMLDRDAFCIVNDDFGYLYLTSNHGLWRILEKDLNDFYHGRKNYLIPFFYGEETGILNTEFNGGFQNNYLKTKYNHLYFPSLQGIIIVAPEEHVFRKLRPCIDNVYVDDTLAASDKHVFERSTYSVQFDYSCVNFLNKYNIYFQYKLEKDGGNENGWSTLQKSQSASFKLLPPGRYTFYLRAIDAFNDSNPTVITYHFEIKPVFYETHWFHLSIALAFLIFTISIARYRIQRHKRKAGEKERYKRQLAELELKALQSQMNPHFIFNSLNSIKYYLSINDQTKADIYLDHFSLLLRDFLQNSDKVFIPVENEIKTLRAYIELEKQRLNPGFDFFMTVPDNVLQCLIPTHVLQPFVENAIKHGIAHSLKKCYIRLTFEMKAETIVCTIEDNGIGRVESAKINQTRQYHVSKGITIVSEKLKTIKEIYGKDITYTIEDISNQPQQITGTRVIIQIPHT